MSGGNELAKAVQALDRQAMDRALSARERVAAIVNMLRHDSELGKVRLLQIGNDPTEAGDVLDLVGERLARLAWAGVVSEFDVRDLTDRAADAFFANDP